MWNQVKRALMDGSAHHQPPMVCTALDEIAKLENHAQALLQQILANRHVQAARLTPTEEQLRQYLALTKQGILYTCATYHPGALPAHYQICSEITAIDEQLLLPNVVAYNYDNDAFRVTCLHLARLCTSYQHPESVFLVDRLQPFAIHAEALTLLYAIEECYHRYQLRIRGDVLISTVRKHDTRLEQEITPIWQQAIQALALPVVELPEEAFESCFRPLAHLAPETRALKPNGSGKAQMQPVQRQRGTNKPASRYDRHRRLPLRTRRGT